MTLDDAKAADQLDSGGLDAGRRLRRGLASLVFLVVLVAALIFAVPGLREVGERLSDVNPLWVVLAVVLEVLSCVGFVLAFQLIFYRVPLVPATRVAFSEMAFGAVVPAGGAGGIAVGAWIVKVKGGSVTRFAELSAVLFLLTSAINVFTLVGGGVLVALGVGDVPGSPLLLGGVPAVAGLLVIGAFLCVPRLARRSDPKDPRRTVRWFHATSGVIHATWLELRHPRWRLVGAVMYLWCDIAVLWVCFRAFGHSPDVAALAVAFLIGYLGNVIPVPGGVGVLDGGMTGALVLYGHDATTAAAAVLVYHALVLFIPTLLGTIAFLRLRKTLDEPLVLLPERGVPAEEAR